MMNTARRGQKAAFPQLRRPPSRNFPSGAVPPPFSHASTIPASARARHLTAASTPSGRGVRTSVTMQSVEK
jgi:hypothetical protein